MKQLFRLSIWATTTVCAQANLIPNGNFEQEDNGAIAGWQTGPWETIPSRVLNDKAGAENRTIHFLWDTVSHGTGQGAIRFDGEGYQRGPKNDSAFGIFSTLPGEIKVRPKTQYRLTWYYKSTGLSNASTLTTDVFYQTAGTPTDPMDGSKMVGHAVDVKKVDAPDWQQETLTFTTPEDIDWVQVRLEVSSDEPGKKFSVWMDDFDLEPTDTTISSTTPCPSTWVMRQPVQEGDPSGLAGFKMVEPPIPYGSQIQRTMRLLATSTPEHRNQVRILFYGQSIIALDMWKTIIGKLKEQYPNADIIATNPSIGGFMSDTLQDTMYGDCYPANADLILFHDYIADGPQLAQMEAMFANMRLLTTAEVMPYTHHVSWIGNAMHAKGDQEQSDAIIKWALNDGFEPIDIRSNWKAWLSFTNDSGGDLLRGGDVVHLGESGQTLWTKFTMPHFVYDPQAKPTWRKMVRVYTPDGNLFTSNRDEYPSTGSRLTSPLTFPFVGSRIDLLGDWSSDAKPGTAKILIDGKAPSTYPELYWADVHGMHPPDHWWPMIRRFQLGGHPVVQDWKITFSKMSETGEDFTYEVNGSVTGPDGIGNAKEKFVSKSGQLTIEPEWFTVKTIVGMKKKPYPDGTYGRMSVHANFIDVWSPKPPENRASEDRYTLASGLSNGPHTLEIIPNGDGDLPLRAIVVHQPPADLAAMQR